MEDLDYWRLCEELNVDQAAHLLIGFLPGEVEAQMHNGADLSPKSQVRYVTNLQAATAAISNALRSGSISGQYTPNFNRDITGNRTTHIENSINLDESTVQVGSLKQWLSGRGFRKGFFFPDQTDAPDYLDEKNARYAPKLAAAIRAWQSVVETNGRHPKQALAKWLREHAAEFGMTDDEGNLVNQAIDDVSKIANWQPTGGAPKTSNE